MDSFQVVIDFLCLTWLEELDSYLYQTVGQDAIELVSQALDIPLYRKIITGSAVEQGSEYGSRTGGPSSGVKGDETEDLYQLLSDVKVTYKLYLNSMGFRNDRIRPLDPPS